MTKSKSSNQFNHSNSIIVNGHGDNNQNDGFIQVQTKSKSRKKDDESKTNNFKTKKPKSDDTKKKKLKKSFTKLPEQGTMATFLFKTPETQNTNTTTKLTKPKNIKLSQTPVQAVTTPLAWSITSPTYPVEPEMPKVDKNVHFQGLKTGKQEKSPMAELNDLCRFHKLEPLYELISQEPLPKNKWLFTVRLTLNEKCYVCQANTIRLTQQSCAAACLKETNLKFPKSRKERQSMHKNAIISQKVENFNNSGKEKVCEKGHTHTSNTVKLNSIAMQRNWTVEYKELNTRVLAPEELDQNSNALTDENDPKYKPNDSNKLKKGNRPRVEIIVQVSVNGQKFTGKGKNLQYAKHNAALIAMKELSLTSKNKETPELNKEALPFVPNVTHHTINMSNVENKQKTQVQEIYELGAKLKMAVAFNVCEEYSNDFIEWQRQLCIENNLDARNFNIGNEFKKNNYKIYRTECCFGPTLIKFENKKSKELLIDEEKFRILNNTFIASTSSKNKPQGKLQVSAQIIQQLKNALGEPYIQFILDHVLNGKNKNTKEHKKVESKNSDISMNKMHEQMLKIPVENDKDFLDLGIKINSLYLKDGEKTKPLTLATSVPGKIKSDNKMNKMGRKLQNIEGDNELHPISRLTQIAQILKLNDPTYKVLQSCRVLSKKDVNSINSGESNLIQNNSNLLEEISHNTRICKIECQFTYIDGKVYKAVATGRNKKEAKKIAASQVLKKIRFDPVSYYTDKVDPVKSSFKVKNDSKINKNVGFVDKREEPKVETAIAVPKSESKPKIDEKISKTAESAIEKLEKMKTDKIILKLDFKNMKRKSGDILCILNITNKSGKNFTLHSLGKDEESAKNECCEKALKILVENG